MMNNNAWRMATVTVAFLLAEFSIMYILYSIRFV